MTLAASMLPNPEVAVAAIGLAYNVYGILFITFVAFSMAACVQVNISCSKCSTIVVRLYESSSFLNLALRWGIGWVLVMHWVPRSQPSPPYRQRRLRGSWRPFPFSTPAARCG